MKKHILAMVCIVVLLLSLTSCNASKKPVKIGVSLGVGAALRWEQEKVYMQEAAKTLGAEIEVRLNKTDQLKTQKEDCYEMIDNGIDVLIFMHRDVNLINEIIDYAKEKNVKLINYARVMLNKNMDLFVGYDNKKIGQSLGQYLSEIVDQGDYIILKGDPDDPNAQLLYEGAMIFITPIKNNINIILDEAVVGWSPEEAKRMVTEAIKANSNKVDAILAPNDKIAGACAQAIEELNITSHVAITGMDAELDAIKRIVAGKQDVTIYMDLKELAVNAVNAAYNMATNKPVDINAKFDNGIEGGVDSNLIMDKLVTKQNIDSVLIDSGYFTKEEVYGAK